MKVKLDENVTARAADLLRTAGHDTETVVDQDMRGAADIDLIAACTAEDRLLITFDVGFGDVRSYPPGTHAGVVVLRLGDQQPAETLSIVERFVATHDLEALRGALAVLTDDNVRIRR